MVEIVRYTPERQAEWDTFVRSSRNGTFLFERAYMDYHAHRFTDCSLMFYRKGRLVALLPANWVESEHTIHSHQGLTYGGLVMSKELTGIRVMDIFATMTEWMRTELNALRLIYKPIPYIYNRYPSEEDLYALFRNGATLHTRGISSAIDMRNPYPLSKGRKSTAKRALNSEISISESTDLFSFWEILKQVLGDRHQTSPVHSLEEMQLLQSRFPEQIRLFAVHSADGRMLAGTLIYEMEHLVHAQYMAASLEGKELGAMDALYTWLIGERYAKKHYLDFGISTEQGGYVLNEGLLRQKEAFGARAVVYDSYAINL